MPFFIIPYLFEEKVLKSKSIFSVQNKKYGGKRYKKRIKILVKWCSSWYINDDYIYKNQQTEVNMKTASKNGGKGVKKASKTIEKPVKSVVKKTKAAKEEKAGPAKAPAKKTAPVKKEAAKAPAKKVAPVKKEAVKTPAKKVAPVKKEAVKAPAKKVAPVKKEAVKAPAKKAAPVKKEAVKAPAKKAAISQRVKLGAAAVKSAELHIKKVKLTKTEKKFFQDLLMKERAKFGEQLKFHADEALTSRKDSGAGRAGMATHMADLGSDNFRHDFELGLLSGEADVMEMIDEALQRLEDSEYGVCLDCGEKIPHARLVAKPYARYCTKCKSFRESTEDGSRRR